jgi:hypothetical protein
MSTGPVHFELFVRRKVNAPWSLELATEDRARALETAEELLADGRAAAVKVCKETLDEETRTFKSVTLLSKGAVESRKDRTVREFDDSPLCVTPQDLYTIHARDRIGRLLEGWLRRHAVTPFELLHRPDLVERLDASGVEIQHAVQKLAVPEAQARGLTTHEMIRTFQALIDRSVERVLRDGRRSAFPMLDKTNFAEAVEQLIEEPERAYLIGGGVAGFLAGAEGWGAKVGRLLDLAEAAPKGERARALAFHVLEQPLSEIVAVKNALSDLTGPDLDLGAHLAALTNMAASAEVKGLLSLDPGFARDMPALQGEAARLAYWLRKDVFENVRTGLARRIVRDLIGPRRLRPGDADGEIKILRTLAMALMASTPRLLPPDDVHEAFVERSKTLVGGDFVGLYLADRGSAMHEVEALIRLAENIAGAINKRAAARWILAAINANRFEKEIRTSVASAPAKLAGLADLQRTLRRAGLPEPDEAACLGKIGEIGGLIEADARLILTLARSEAPMLPRLIVLLRLAAAETGPTGPVAERARAEVVRLFRSQDVRAQLAAQPQSIETVKTLMVEAGLAA